MFFFDSGGIYPVIIDDYMPMALLGDVIESLSNWRSVWALYSKAKPKKKITEGEAKKHAKDIRKAEKALRELIESAREAGLVITDLADLEITFQREELEL